MDHGGASRWAHVGERLPAHLEELSGPATGAVELPLYLAWSGLRRFEVSDEKLLLGLYRIVLMNGLRDDLIGYLNAELLVKHWPRLRIALGKPVRLCWEQHFPELAVTAVSTSGRIPGMSNPTSIKTTEAVRDRLRVLAAERGVTITQLVEDLASRELTDAEREQRAIAAASELGVEYTEQVQQAGQSAWDKIRAHQGGAAA